MKRLWAPWRIEYIEMAKSRGCIFCLRDQPARDRDNLVLFRTPLSMVMLNRYPYTNGHLLVSPHRHTADLNALTPDEKLDLFDLIRVGCNVLTEAAAPQGFNIGMNLGKAAGAGVDEHLHFHVVPRWNGDTNFMSVVADLRVMPENLLATYDRLLPRFTAARPMETGHDR
jgi:ATP adenylyltransferase